MRKSVLIGLYAIGLLSLALMGFQCSSKEMTSAKLYIQRKEYENAAKQLEAEVAKNPKNEEAWFMLGQVRVELKDFKGMKDAFTEGRKVGTKFKKQMDDQTVAIWGRMFNEGVDIINKAQGPEDFDKAIEKFKLAQYVNPDSAQTGFNIGFAYYRKGDLEAAIPYMQEAFQKSKNPVAVKILTGIYMTRAQDYKSKFQDVNSAELDAVKNLNSIRENMKSADVRFFIGQPASVKTLSDAKQAKGKKSAQSSTKEEWSFPQYNLTLTVEGDYVKAVKYNPAYVPKIDSTNYKLAVAEYNKTIELLKVAISYFPEDAEISDNLMNSYIGADKNKEARELLDERVVKYPESKYDHYNLGVFLLKDNKFEEAVAQFKEVLRIDPAFSQAVYNLAATFVNWGVDIQEKLKKEGKDEDKSYQEKFKLAIPYLEKVVEEKPNDIQILELLGQVYANLNQAEKAKEMYDKADAIRQGKN